MSSEKMMDGNMPSRRDVDRWSRETADTVKKLGDRVSVLEKDMAVTNSRLDTIEERISEIKKVIEKMQTLAVTTLLSVVGSGGFIIYELLKMRIVQ